MPAKRNSYNAVPVSDLVSQVIDPVLAKRAGMTTGLVQAWDEIVGSEIGCMSRPERIRWARRATAEDPFEPATLVIACDSAAALRLQHMTDQIIARVNSFLGFAAIAKIRLVQKPVSPPQPRGPRRRPLTRGEQERISSTVSDVDDPALREALRRLGESVMRQR